MNRTPSIINETEVEMGVLSDGGREKKEKGGGWMRRKVEVVVAGGLEAYR